MPKDLHNGSLSIIFIIYVCRTPVDESHHIGNGQKVSRPRNRYKTGKETVLRPRKTETHRINITMRELDVH